MIPVPDIGHVYPKTGLDADIRFDTTPRFVSEGSCYFNGAAGKITVSAAAGIDGLFVSGGTVAFWIKAASDGEGNYGRIIQTTTAGYNVLTRDESAGAVKVHFTSYWDGDDGVWFSPAAGLTVGVWNHFAVTYNGASDSNNPVMYINGQSVTVTKDDAPTGTVEADGGNKTIGNQAADGRAMHGNLCNLGMWKGTILTQAQVRSVMAATSYAAVQAVVQPTAYYLLSVDGDDSTGNYDGTIS